MEMGSSNDLHYNEGSVREGRGSENRKEICQKNYKLHQIFSQIPKPQIHGGPLHELTSGMEFQEVNASLAKTVNHMTY